MSSPSCPVIRRNVHYRSSEIYISQIGHTQHRRMEISWPHPRFVFKIPSNILKTGTTFEFIPVIIIYNETSAKLLLQFVFLKYFLYLYGMKQKLSSPSFADLFLGQRKVKQTFFSQINTVIDWAPIRAIMEVAYTKGYKSTGRPSYDSLVLFKIELLRTWYGLSDGEVEDQVNDRLSFSRFAGLGMEDIVPDSTTVCRFRNVLVEADLYDTLLAEFNRQLEAKGIIVKRGAIVDASITNTPPSSPRR